MLEGFRNQNGLKQFPPRLDQVLFLCLSFLLGQFLNPFLLEFQDSGLLVLHYGVPDHIGSMVVEPLDDFCVLESVLLAYVGYPLLDNTDSFRGLCVLVNVDGAKLILGELTVL